jgi:O-antigen/teichoic acid export membrane protein
MAYSIRSIVKGTTIFTAGHVLIRATGFILIPIYTKYLTTEDYGVIGIVSVVVSILVAALSLGIPQAQTRFFYDDHQGKLAVGRLLFSINVLQLSVALGACALLSAFGEPLFGAAIDNESVFFYPFIVIAIWTVFFHLFSQLVTNFYVTTKRHTYCAVLLFIQFLVSVSLVIYFVVFRGEGALGSIKGIFLGQLVFCAVFYWPYARRFVWRLSFRNIRDVLAMGLPVAVYLTATAVLLSIDKLIVKSFLPMSSVGLYTLGYKFGFVMSVVVVSINRAWLPNYYELMNQTESSRAYEVKRMFCLWITVLGAICIAASAWSDEVVRLMTTPAFFPAASVVPAILLAFFFQGIYHFMVGPLFYFKRTALLPVITVAGALVNIGLNFLLIPRYGIQGAAGAALASFLVLAVLAFFAGRTYFNPRFELGRIILLMAAVSVMSIGGNTLGWHWSMEGLLAVAYLLLCFVLFPRYLRPLAQRAVEQIRRE